MRGDAAARVDPGVDVEDLGAVRLGRAAEAEPLPEYRILDDLLLHLAFLLA
jgi:hypothetical protein